MNSKNKENLIIYSDIIEFIQFFIGILSIFGSLYFSVVMKWPPCDLCWYQRIFIYPVPIIILTNWIIKDSKTIYQITPFILIGLVISIYHNLIYYKIIRVLVPCNEKAPCTAEQLNMFGFLTIPLLSLIAFTGLFLLQLIKFYILKKSKIPEI